MIDPSAPIDDFCPIPTFHMPGRRQVEVDPYATFRRSLRAVRRALAGRPK